MITLQSAEKALKTVYLGAITSILNTKSNVLLSQIKQSTDNIYGTEVRKALRTGINGAVGAGDETGALPKPSQSQYAQMKIGLKNLYGQIQISDKAVRASQNGDAAFVNLLNAETESLLEGAKNNFARMLYGDGSGFLGTGLGSYLKSLLVTSSAQNFFQGQRVDIYNAEGTQFLATVTLSFVDYANNEIHFKDYEVDQTKTFKLYASGSKDKELTGLGYLFKYGRTDYYGIPTSEDKSLVPVRETSATITETQIQRMLDKLEMSSGTQPNLILCSFGTRRVLLNLLSSYKRNITPMELKGGFNAISYNGIPVVADRFMPTGTIYFLNTNDFILHQLCDWSWLENQNGHILKQLPDKAAYSATLVKYCELVCDRPNAQGCISGITEM